MSDHKTINKRHTSKKKKTIINDHLQKASIEWLLEAKAPHPLTFENPSLVAQT